MDRRVAMILIVMGALLVMTPPASDYLHGRNVVRAADTAAAQTKGSWSIKVGDPMGKEYRFGCWGLGAGRIGISVLFSLRGRQCGKDG